MKILIRHRQHSAMQLKNINSYRTKILKYYFIAHNFSVMRHCPHSLTHDATLMCLNHKVQ
jgi:hypothetical protein